MSTVGCPNCAHLVTRVKAGSKGGIVIDRRSMFGNPFKIGPDGDRELVVKKFWNWVRKPEQANLLKEIKKLKGRAVKCHCTPELCHGHVIVHIANCL